MPTDIPTPTSASDRSGGTLGDVAAVFLRLGATSFGGPAAHTALMRQEVVQRRGWVSDAEFLDLLGATNLIPGPNSTELAIHIGYRVAGLWGLIVAGVCFILPAAAIVTAIAWFYVRFGQLPAVAGVLYGVKPVIIAIIVQAFWKLGRTCLGSWSRRALFGICLLAAGARVHELLIVLGAGTAVGAWRALRRRGPAPPPGIAAAITPAWTLSAGMVLGAAQPFGQLPLFLFFLRVGAVLFGSGYVLVAFLRAGLVERYGWLTEQQLLDAVAVGQFTPGPVFTTATFIGYLLGGPMGGLLATVGIFLPAFVFVGISVPILTRLKASTVARGFLDGVNVASLALMVAVTWWLAWTAITDVPTALLAGASALLLVRFQVNSVWLILAGAVCGLVMGSP
ncbi:MAG: chromate efflux transporter [Pirellulaceae bacterium]